MMKTVEPPISHSEDPGRDGPEVGPLSHPWPAARATVRVLVIFEGEYRAYGDAIAGALGCLRPHAEVVLAEPTNLQAEVARVSPHLVISSRPKAADPARTPAWVELPNESGTAGRICFGEYCLEADDLVLEDLLQVIDRTESLIRA